MPDALPQVAHAAEIVMPPPVDWAAVERCVAAITVRHTCPIAALRDIARLFPNHAAALIARACLAAQRSAA